MNKKPSITLLCVLLLILNRAEIFAQSNTVFPRLTPDPKALEYYNLITVNANPTWLELAQISLWASGDTSMQNSDVQNAPANSPLARIIRETAALSSSPDYPSNDREKAEFILEYLYKNILRTYSSTQTRVDSIFTNGRYNCVSSAVLYMIFCEYAGINSSGVITRDHALLTLHINGEDIDVETTNRYGFDPGNRREFHDQFGRLTGFSYVPARNYRDRQTIGNIELISIIFNNRISELERQNRWAEAVPLAIDRAALLYGNTLNAPRSDSSGALFTDPRNDLMDRLFNYGVSLLRANREEDSILWAVSASSIYPDDERWQEFIAAAVNNRTARFLRERKFSDARNFLDSHANILTEANYAQLDTVIIEADISNKINLIADVSNADTVISAVEQMKASGRINEVRASEMIISAIQRTAALLCAAPARNWRAAIAYLEKMTASYGGKRELEQALQTYKNNLAADYHNRFAAEWNKRNYDEAERILIEGLSQFPDNRQLTADRDIVERQRSRNN